MIRHSIILASMVFGLVISCTLAHGAGKGGVRSKMPALEREAQASFRFKGWMDHYLKAVTLEWLLQAPDSNPAMIEMFKDRDRTPSRDLLPWSGEFAGKYLTSAVQVYRVNRDANLLARMEKFVSDLIACQDTDGYLGPWPKNDRLAGHWDSWGHYHVMMGLILWFDETGDRKALDCGRRIGDLLCGKFLGAKPGNRMIDIGNPEMNLAPIHSLCLLYERTGEGRYLQMAGQIADELQTTDEKGAPVAGDYMRLSLSGKEYYQSPKPRWEALHTVMGLAELYRNTGDERYRDAFESIWWSIAKLDRHNNGGFSTGECAVGNPYVPGAIETCSTISWIALSVDMLKLTANSIVADEIELTALNSVVGMHSPSGRWCTYSTPMDGVRKSSTQDIAFQAREGSPELNCCSVNAARGFGIISDWAVMRSAYGGVVLNYYGPSTIEVKLDSGNKLSIRQNTEYPAEGQVTIEVSPARAELFTFNLRIPHWSANTTVKVNGKAVEDVVPGRYLALKREWKPKDKVVIDLNMGLHYWIGEKECEGKTSIYRGPILLTYDRYYNDMDPDSIPALDAANAGYRRITTAHPKRQPIVLLEFGASNGHKLRLCDFGSAGYAGTPYRSWLKVNGAQKTEFSRENPLRSRRCIDPMMWSSNQR